MIEKKVVLFDFVLVIKFLFPN